LLKEEKREGLKSRKDAEEDVSDYWMTLREKEDTVN
jgi:hypothetical protein